MHVLVLLNKKYSWNQNHPSNQPSKFLLHHHHNYLVFWFKVTLCHSKGTNFRVTIPKLCLNGQKNHEICQKLLKMNVLKQQENSYSICLKYWLNITWKVNVMSKVCLRLIDHQFQKFLTKNTKNRISHTHLLNYCLINA